MLILFDFRTVNAGFDLIYQFYDLNTTLPKRNCFKSTLEIAKCHPVNLMQITKYNMIYQIHLRRTSLAFVKWLFLIYFKSLTYIFDKYLYTYSAVQDFYSIVLKPTMSSLRVWRSFIALAPFYSAKKHNL